MATRKEELADRFTQEKVDGKGLNPKWPTMRQWLAASFDAYELAIIKYSPDVDCQGVFDSLCRKLTRL